MDKKKQKPDMMYRSWPNRDQYCAKCTMFVPNDSCTAVEGDISPNGWCALFKRKVEIIRP